ncbi:MAG TPA: EAL domain-containing protein [Leptolyngbyaceae cyanobacterium]
MLRLKSNFHSWGLQTRLLLPIGLVLGVALTQAIFTKISTERQMELLVHRQGVAVLDDIIKSTAEKRLFQEKFAQLLSMQSGLAQAIKKNDRQTLTNTLSPFHQKINLGDIHVYNQKSQEILKLGEILNKKIELSMIKSALSGLSNSKIEVTPDGLIILASSPIIENRNIVGAILVSHKLSGKALEQLKPAHGVQLALFHQNKLVGSMVSQPGLPGVVSQFKSPKYQLSGIDKNFIAYNFYLTSKPLTKNSLLVALVPIEEFVSVAKQQNIIFFISNIVLLFTLSWFILVLDRDIAKPLKIMVNTTLDMVNGNYHRRVLPCQIPELNDLAKSINFLAEKLEVQLAKLSHQAYHDTLTNLPNRALFLNNLEKALMDTKKYKSSSAVLFLDLDGFKVINDSLGHKTGDRLLMAVSKRLKECVRSQDVVARFGGDEFTILLKDITEEKEAINVAERIIQKLQTPFILEGREVFISSSIGIALDTGNCDRGDALLRNADSAMYEAKKRGKSRYTLFQPEMDSRAFERLQLATDLRKAIEHQELRLYYQPVVQLESGIITEVEALVRWQHPYIGLISPAKFIPLAEETGLILQIGEWVLQKACQQARTWQLQHPGYPPLIVGVNLSPKQFQQPELVEKIAEILTLTELPPQCLKLEITESMMMEEGETTIATLYRLKQLGIGLAIDDFGTGFSALNYLKRFPVDTLKIDGSFIKGLGHNREDTAIVHAVIAFAKALHLSVTAEGVETSEQLSQLKLLGCDRGQGYYFCAPISGDAVKMLIDKLLQKQFFDPEISPNSLIPSFISS